MNPIINTILSKMFVGGYARLPSFRSLDITEIDLDSSVEEFFLNETSVINLEEVDVNHLLKSLKKKDNFKVSVFIDSAMELYFTHPLVTISIQNGRETLFPHQRALKDIDYDLLIPVFEKEIIND